MTTIEEPTMRSPARPASDHPGAATAPVDRRFGAAALGHADPPPSPPAGTEPPGDAPGRRPGLVRMLVPAVGLLVLAAFLLGRWLANRGEVVVWQATRPIPAGKTLAAADLRQGAVGRATADGTLPATVDPEGLVARVPIPAGALLTAEVLTRGPALPGRGEALVGVALAPGAAPADGLAAGDLVRVVRLPVTPEEISLSSSARLVLPAAPVWAARPGKDGATVVTLRVAVEHADHLAGLSARGAVALERVAAPG
jgi:SAF domain-containing protein